MTEVHPTVDVRGVPAACLGEEGWARRSILSEPRPTEAVEAYRALGMEVAVVDIDATTAKECSSCLEASPGTYKVVYTRPGRAPPLEDGLFD
ncbi:MAG: hypothetical protein L0Z54_00875 [Thermoplasmata archaeon]|nr:hypothetical protein [Thermoplasmata archaeon]